MFEATKARARWGRPAAAAAIAAGALAVLAPTSQAAFLPANADFNGDGVSDVAVGAPNDSVQGQDAAGAVNVIYGRAGTGLSAANDQQFTQATGGIAGAPDANDRFGEAVAAGDLNGDGIGDLAIGVPGESVSGSQRAGMVHVLYGSSNGLRTANSNTWTQDSAGIRGVSGENDGFGTAVAIADFDGDGRDDLSIGAPGDTVSGRTSAGTVNVLYGTGSGLTAARDQLWTQDTPGIKGIAAAGAQFGSALAADEMSGNARDDLAIGIPGGRISGNANAGAVLVLYGRSAGLSSVDHLWSQDEPGVKGVAADGDRFGVALGIGDFDRDGIGDLAIGVPLEDVGGESNAGAVNVLYGSGRGVRSNPDDFWTQDTPGIRGVAGANDRFGTALEAVDFSRNVADDLAIGAPGDRVGGNARAGAVNVLYGNARSGLGSRASQVWTQNSRGVKGVAGTNDGFGSALTAGDFDADNAFDLVVGVPGETIARVSGAGAVHVLPGSGAGVTDDPDQFWSQGSAGIAGAVGTDSFGAAVASGSR